MAMAIAAFALAGCGTIDTKPSSGWRYYDQDSRPVLADELINEMLYGCPNSATGSEMEKRRWQSCKPGSPVPASFSALYEESKSDRTDPSKAQEMLRAGMTVGELLCDDLFTGLKRAQNINANVRDQTNLVGGLTNTLLAIGKANAAISNTIAAVFSFSGASMEAYNANMLFAPDIVKVHRLVRKSQDVIRKELTSNSPPTNFHDGISALNSFLYQCHIVGINELVQTAIADGKPGLEAETSARKTFLSRAISEGTIKLSERLGVTTLNETQLRDLYWLFVQGAGNAREKAYLGNILSKLEPPAFDVRDDQLQVPIDMEFAQLSQTANKLYRGPAPKQYALKDTLKNMSAEIHEKLSLLNSPMKLSEQTTIARSALANAWKKFDEGYSAALAAAKIFTADGELCTTDATTQVDKAKRSVADLRTSFATMERENLAFPSADLAKLLLVKYLVAKLPDEKSLDADAIKKLCDQKSGFLANTSKVQPTPTTTTLPVVKPITTQAPVDRRTLNIQMNQ